MSDSRLSIILAGEKKALSKREKQIKTMKSITVPKNVDRKLIYEYRMNGEINVQIANEIDSDGLQSTKLFILI